MGIILITVFLILLLLDLPVAYCMLLSSLAALLYMGVDPVMVGLETTRSLSSFYSFLAVPFFILAGELMNQGGLSNRLVRFVKSLIGHKRGGLLAVTCVSSQMFGAVSGASAATCAAVGSIMIPALEKKGYSRAFATALASCAGTTGALIPPSILLIIYGTIANVSIERLFLGGVIPGVLVGVGLIIMGIIVTRKINIVKEGRADRKEIIHSIFGSLFALLLVALIFGGIIGGVFTATEASAIAVIYAFLVGFLIYRELKLKDLPKILVAASKTTASLSFLIACASLFAWTLSIGKVPELFTQGIVESCNDLIYFLSPDVDESTFLFYRKIMVLVFVNLILLLFGMFIDAGPGLLIVVPVVLPISEAIGMDSGLSAVHFGVMVVSNMIIGLVTPPVGSTLFVGSAVGNVSVTKMTPHVLKLLLVMIIVQLVVTYFAPVTTFLPSLMK